MARNTIPETRVSNDFHVYDQWSVDELLDLASGFGRDAGR